MDRFRTLIARIVLASFLASTPMHPLFAPVSATPATNFMTQRTNETVVQQVDGLNFRLSEGSERSKVRPRKEVTTAELSSGEIETILRRLPSMELKESDEQAFRFPERSLPPPVTGLTRVVSFPAATTEVQPMPNQRGPLEVLSYAPEGNVSFAPYLSITFSQPMVAINSQANAAETVPLKLSPEPPGRWRWLGTKTLIFEPDGRFPMATKYSVTIPKGTRSTNGNSLSNEKVWTFVTPPPSVKYSYPGKDETLRRDALIFIEFDQRIDPAAVLQLTKVRVGSRTLPTRLATAKEIEQEILREPERAKPLRESQKGRTLALRILDPATGKTEKALPADSLIAVSIGAGTPSSEGPERTTDTYHFLFHTHGSLTVKKASCGGSRCYAHSNFIIGFSFGVWTPWWTSSPGPDSAFRPQTFNALTDPEGTHRLRINFDSVNPPRPSVVTAQATVTDVNRQTWSSTTTLLVHPAELYVGLKSEKTFVQSGEPIIIQAIASDLEGHLIEGRTISISVVQVDWQYQEGAWKEVETNKQECSIQSARSAVICSFQPAKGGKHRVAARVTDDLGRQNESQITIWVAGGKPQPEAAVEKDDVDLIPNQRDYRGGDTAEILVQSPFYPAEGLLTLRRSGILKSERFRMDSATTTVRIPIEQSWTPNVYVQVDLVGTASREVPIGGAQNSDKPARPAYASGELNLPVFPYDRRLMITAVPEKAALEPGAQTGVSVEVKDFAGKPVAGEVVLFVVDEAILALTSYKLSDPISRFYADRSEDVSDYSLRENVLLSTELAFGGEGGGGGGLRSRGGTLLGKGIYPARVSNIAFDAATVMADLGLKVQDEMIRLRTDFNPLAIFTASVKTDDNGRADVKFRLPDSLTRYRVMAVAVAGENQFGLGESTITARLPLMVRTSAPRFLNFGDQFELPIVIQNQTESEIKVNLAVRSNNMLQFTEPPNSSPTNIVGRHVIVPADDRIEVRIPTVANKTGLASFQVGVVSGPWADAANGAFPVLTPGTSESFATYGEIDQGAISQTVEMPNDVWSQYGGLQIETSSTQLQQLTDAFVYLQNYPFECAEQLASRILSIAALKDVLGAFELKDFPSSEALAVGVARDIRKLERMQNDDGGFSFWSKDNHSWPYLSVHVAHALVMAKQNNFAVPDVLFEKSLRYLKTIDQRFPSSYGVDAQWAITAYALHVRALTGDRDTARARRMLGNGNAKYLSLETNGWLLSVLAGDKDSTIQREAIKTYLQNRAVETAGAAHFVSSYSDADYVILNSRRRADGVILGALIADEPDHPLITKVVRGLLGHRVKGRWENTQENVFILLSLSQYFQTHEKMTPEFVARVWLGNAFASEQQFRGREIDKQQVNVPMSYLAEKLSDAGETLVVSKDGPGRLYYRLTLNYAPKDLRARAADYGFAVERVYEAVDHPSDVSREIDGTWRIKAGTRVRVRLKMVVPSRRTHVALADPLPAGFEILNPDLAVTEKLPEDPRSDNDRMRSWWIWRPVWFEHQNLRDDRAEAFASLLPAGVYDYSYVVRATTLGLFEVAPAKAEEMYHPETFGRSQFERVRVE